MNALVMVDVQNDFCPGGALPVPEGQRFSVVYHNDASEAASNPANWMPWNYRETLAGLASLPGTAS